MSPINAPAAQPPMSVTDLPGTVRVSRSGLVGRRTALAGAGRMLSVAVAGTLFASATAVAAAPVHAAGIETYLRPADSIVTISGQGFGHGHGMSQWGAYGAAKVYGLSWKQILGFYYPGTTAKDMGDPYIRVRLNAVGAGALTVFNTPGLRLAGIAITAPQADTKGITAYRVSPLPTSGKLQVAALTTAGWKDYPSAGAPSVVSSPAVFTSPSTTGVVDVKLANGTRRGYRGTINANRASATTLTTVSVLRMENYLRAVVPAEMPASWSPEAVKAQAVAARTYAEFDLGRAPAGQTWDTCDNTSCQMYSGLPAENPASDAAVLATKRQTLLYKGAPAFTQFGAANGGWTVAGSASQPYLTAKADKYDGAIPNDAHSWTANVTAARIQAQWPSIGSYRELQIIVRNGNGIWGGPVTTAAIVGSSRTITVTGSEFQWAFGLRSGWFRPTTGATTSVGPVAHLVTKVVSKPVAKPAAVSWAATRYTAYKGAVLRQGSRGTAVVVLQRALKVTADGAFGAKTRAALVAFEKKQRIAPNGVANRLVWNRLEQRDYPLVGYRRVTLKQGSRGAAVVAVQRALRVTATGGFTAKTTAAVKAVQRRARIKATGVVSGQTWVAIEAWMPR